MTKPCPDKRRALTLHVVGELTRTEHDEIERHIELCARCREHSTALHRVANLYALSSADAVEVLDCQEFRHDLRRRFLLERSNRAWGLGQFLFTGPRLAWSGVVLIGAALIVVWMLSRGESAIELAQEKKQGLPGASQNLVSATIARIDSQSRSTPTWMYYSDTLSSEALDQLLYREWMRKVLPPLSLDLPGH